MRRDELEGRCLTELDAGNQFVELELPGDPSSTKIRLFGHRKGPKGTVIGWRGNNVRARFDASQVLAFIDELPADSGYFT